MAHCDGDYGAQSIAMGLKAQDEGVRVDFTDRGRSRGRRIDDRE